MPGFTINTDDIKRLPKEVVDKWSASGFDLPIEEIAKDLDDAYDFDELTDLESEFIFQQIPEASPSFMNKISAIIAINVNPSEYFTDLIGFANVVCVCNDTPMPDINVGTIPSRYIERTLDVINKITPPDMEMDDAYFCSNIQNYIFQCYILDSLYVLPLQLRRTYGESFLVTSGLPVETQTMVRKNYEILDNIDTVLENDIDNVKAKLKDEPGADSSTVGLLEGLGELGLDGFMLEQINQYISNQMYTKFYIEV